MLYLIILNRRKANFELNGKGEKWEVYHTVLFILLVNNLKSHRVFPLLHISSNGCLRSRVVSVHCSNALLCLLVVRPHLSCRLPCSQLEIKRWRSMHCRQACVYTATRSREVHMYGKTCGVRGRPPVVRLPKKPSA